MDYFPEYVRVHINVHFITVIGKEGSKYIVSDCYHPERTELDRESLRKGIKRADDNLSEMSKRMMEIGDRWCDFSLFAARIGKKRGL